MGEKLGHQCMVPPGSGETYKRWSAVGGSHGEAFLPRRKPWGSALDPGVGTPAQVYSFLPSHHEISNLPVSCTPTTRHCVTMGLRGTEPNDHGLKPAASINSGILSQ